MEKVKWGVLGTANIARGCTIPGMKKAGNCELYAIAGRNPEKAESFAKEFGFTKSYGSYQALLDDENVQAVYIPLPNGLHFEWVLAAIGKGKHVLCEKPMALSSDDAIKMYAAAARKGVLLMEAYAYLHSPYVESLMNDVKSGIIGDIDYVETAFVTQGYSEDIRLHKDQGGGAMYDLGCYCTTMILSLIDSAPEYVKADAEYSDLGVDLMTSALIRFENGSRAAFNVGMVLGIGTDSRYDRLYVHGSKGCIISYAEYNQEGEISYIIKTKDETIERKVTAPQNYSLEIEQFGNCILNGEEPHVSPEFSIMNSKLMDKIFEEIGY